MLAHFVIHGLNTLPPFALLGGVMLLRAGLRQQSELITPVFPQSPDSTPPQGLDSLLPRNPVFPEAEPAESEERFRRAYEEAAVGMVMLDLSGHVIAVNQSITEITGYEKADFIGRPATEILAPEHHQDFSAAVAEIIASGRGGYRRERRLVRKDKRSIWVRNSATILHRDGKPAEIFVICEDITERRYAIDQLHFQATHDELTGLMNRRRLETQLSETVASCLETGVPAALFFLDLDGFKLINDTLGHHAGDAVLCQTADLLSEALDDGDILARFGGDEFAIIVRDARDRAALERKATGLLTTLRKCHPAGCDLYLGASLGIAICPEDGHDAGTLLQSADSAMYESKRQGRNRFSFFTTDIREGAEERLRIESNLQAALESNEIFAVFQPQYDARSGRLVRFEALCRWKSAKLGYVSPSRFIPVAEQNGTIIEIGRFMLRSACNEAYCWQQAGSDITVAVNVSPVEFSRPGYVQSVAEILRESGLDPRRLELELTESVVMRDLEQSIERIGQLHALGIQISIDDFGTGFSSLSYLSRMPIDAVKIDRSFIRDLDSNPQSVSMVRSVIEMAHAISLRVVTEGIEKETQAEVLRRLSCDEVQGYLYGGPDSPEAARGRIMEDAVIEDWR